MLETTIADLLPDTGVDQTQADMQRQEQVQLFGDKLDTLFRKQVADKALLEDRWLRDIRQYSGEYEDDVIAKIREAGGSEAFVNLTRVKCNATESRLCEMLLPTDDRNWAIEPTPVPELQLAKRKRETAVGPDGRPLVGPNGPVSIADQAAESQKDAQIASDLMQQYMDDQLEECGYNAKLRNVIHNMVVYGTGVLKGPVIRNKVKQTFAKVSQSDPLTGVATEKWALQISEDLAPGAESVSPLDFFPDMRATSMDACEFVFERHRFSKAKLRELAKLPGFMPEQVNAALEAEPDKGYSGLIDTFDSADKTRSVKGGYEVIEYHGPIDREDLIALGLPIDEEDHLKAYQGTVWFCNRRVLKAVLSLLDSGEMVYDVVPLERDDTMLFGFGVPYLMRHSQRAGNAAWRMILDNARLSVGGQVIKKAGKVKPDNGDPRLAPLKGWTVIDPNANVADVFTIVNIPLNFNEMFRILELVRELQDEETGLPQIAQGQQSPAITKTAQGMSLLMNSANTVLRRMVKEFDDAITSRFIRRLYHYNMQYHDDEAAKGDYTVVALGSSSLMVREQQTQGLMQLSQLGATNPEFAKRTKWGDLYRTIVKSMNINADGLVMSEDEVRFNDEQAAKSGPQIPPELQLEMAKLEMGKAELQIKATQAQAEMQIKQAEAAAAVAHQQAQNETERAKITATLEAEKMRASAAVEQARAAMAKVQMDQQLAVLKLAAERDMTLQEVRKEFGLAAMQIESAHAMQAAEISIKNRLGSGI